MATITTCPACRTRFRVTPEQLAAHGGDVRCGRCAKIFRAHNYLEIEEIEPETPPEIPAVKPAEEAPQPAAAEASPPLVKAELRQTPEPPPAAETPAPLEEEEMEEFSLPFSLPDHPPELRPAVAPPAGKTAPGKIAPKKTPVEPIALALVEIPAPAAEAFQPEPAAADETTVVAPTETIAIEKPAVAKPEPIEEERLDLVFPDWETAGETTAEAPPAPKKRGLFWPWLLGAILLLAAMGGQGLYFYRTDLAARYPEFKPLLQNFCGVLQCTIRLPANPDLLSIEASSLEADPAQASHITLNAILRSRAKLAQEYPQLELTLTDTSDKVIARRIFTPREYAKNADLGRGMPPNEELTVKLHLDLGDLTAAGYRVFLFYPK